MKVELGTVETMELGTLEPAMTELVVATSGRWGSSGCPRVPWVAADGACAGRSRRSSGRSSSRRRTSTPTTGRSCCDTTTSSSRRTWRATWARGSGCASRSTTTMPPRRTKVGTGQVLGGTGKVLGGTGRMLEHTGSYWEGF